MLYTRAYTFEKMGSNTAQRETMLMYWLFVDKSRDSGEEPRFAQNSSNK
jgi:hypothetical protein